MMSKLNPEKVSVFQENAERANDFPHHAGGVIQIKHTKRWGTVPELLMEDPKLSLESKGLAAWLSIKPPGWHIAVLRMRKRLAPTGKVMLGKDKWLRIASELEEADYFRRQLGRGPNGQWVWNITFCSSGLTSCFEGESMEKNTNTNAAMGGLADSAEPDHKFIPVVSNTSVVNTTTGGVPERGSSLISTLENLLFPNVTIEFKNEILNIFQKAKIDDVNLAQDFVDELAGAILDGNCGARFKILYPMAWLRKLIEKNDSGEFEKRHCKSVQLRRVARLNDKSQSKENAVQNPRNSDAYRAEKEKILAITKKASIKKLSG